MARVTSTQLSERDRRELRSELVRSVHALKSTDDAWRFLLDLLTPGEILMLGRRIRIAKALLAGERYEDIAAKQRTSYSTIQLVDRSLQHGLEGYRRILRRLESERVTRKRPHLPNETLEQLRALHGSTHLRIWLDAFDRGEEK